jgi:hypothetical protein
VACRHLVPGALALTLAVAAGRPADAATDLPTDDFHIPTLRTATRLALGFDLGVGIFDGTCEPCRYLGGLSLDAYAGVLVTPRLAILAELWTLAHVLPSDGESTGLAFHSFAAVQGRLWMLPELWMAAGLGAGALSVFADDGGTQVGPALLLAVGAEVDHRPDRGIDLALRLGVSFLEDADGRSFELYQVAATVGWHWY